MAESRTRALEIAVVVLIGVAAVFVTVGIYEKQQHHGSAGWFTASAAALLVAVLLPIVVFGVVPLVRRWGARTEQPPPIVASSPGSLADWLTQLLDSEREHPTLRMAPKIAGTLHIDQGRSCFSMEMRIT